MFNRNNSRELLFFTRHELIKWNYFGERKAVSLHEFRFEFKTMPTFGFFTTDQTKFIAMSDTDVLFVDISEEGLKDEDKNEIDYDRQEEITSIKSCIGNDKQFFVLSNKKQGQLGYYLFSINLENPHDPCRYYMNWDNKLDVGDVGLDFMKEKLSDGTVSDSIVVSYKCIGINTYNVFVIDIESGLIKYRHEGFQLWESPIKGFLLDSNEFLILSRDGIQIISLGEKPQREITDKDGDKRMMHSLGETNSLKIEKSNHLYYSF